MTKNGSVGEILATNVKLWYSNYRLRSLGGDTLVTTSVFCECFNLLSSEIVQAERRAPYAYRCAPYEKKFDKPHSVPNSEWVGALRRRFLRLTKSMFIAF